MYGDFSRDSFDPAKHYTRVLMQQGRPLTDADWNEMVECLVREQRELVKSVIGWHGSSDDGFEISKKQDNAYELNVGTYYIDGMLCRNDTAPVVTFPDGLKDPEKERLIYLDAWEESVSAADDAGLLEPALPGIETSVRTRIAWALRVSENPTEGVDPSTNRLTLLEAITKNSKTKPSTRPLLEATLDSTVEAADQQNTSPCEIVRGQGGGQSSWYRIEIHGEGLAGQATLKWSRDNGETVVPLQPVAPGTVLKFADAEGTARERRKRLRENAWVELLDNLGMTRHIAKIVTIQDGQVSVNNITTEVDKLVLAKSEPVRFHSNVIRQWDHNEKVQDKPTIEANKPKEWVSIEKGLKIRLQEEYYYLNGDYWLIRVTSDGKLLVSDPSPAGTTERIKVSVGRRRRHLAPLGTIKKVGNDVTINTPYRKCFKPSGVPDPDRNRKLPCSTPAPAIPAAAPAPAPAGGPSGPPGAAAPAGVPSPDAVNCVVAPSWSAEPINPASLLSGEGARALKSYLATADLTRLIPARYLNYKPKSAIYARFRSALLVSEILEESFQAYFAKVERCISFSGEERPIVEEDARADYDLAVEFQKQITAQRLSSRMA